MKHSKKILIVVSILVIIFAGSMLTYRYIKTQRVLASYEINTSTEVKRVLLVSQQSAFKDKVLDEVKNHFAGKSVYIFVTDATKIGENNPEDWDFIQIITTIESNDLQKDVYNYLMDNRDYSNVSLLTTADSQEWKNKNLDIDAYTSASKQDNVLEYVNRIIDNIESIMK